MIHYSKNKNRFKGAFSTNKPGKELKRIARQNLCGHFGIPMGVSLAATLLPLVLELPFSMLQDTHQMLSQTIVFYVANFLISLVTVILSAGVIRVSVDGKKAALFF